MENTYNPTLAEKTAQEIWEQQQTYSALNNPGPLFSIDTPPPTVSGSLHIGHVFSYTQTDIIARYKRMEGYSVFYPFGFDDNGLATERFVEKKCNVSSYQLGRSAFIDLCLKETAETEKLFESLWRKMGLSIDWAKCYSTISPQARRLSQKSFVDLYKKGYIYRKEEPALYCPACRTSVAQAELEDVEKPSTFNDLVFKAADGSDLIVATTRPELLPACVALFYNPNDARYQHLKDTQATVPLFNLTVPILADDRVVIEKGTGLVMCCTFGDKTDIEWFKAYNLPYRQALGRDGRMTELAGFLVGKKPLEARQMVIERLLELGLIRSQKPITHSVNIHERCKNEIEYLALPQWFLKILPYKKDFLAFGDQVAWYPSYMKSRYVNWVENLSWDWCLSRQRYYGIPFPVWYCVSCNEILLAEESTLPVDPQESKPAACTKCTGTDLIPDTDVMDTWNTSSLTPYIAQELAGSPEGFLPMSIRPQAHDIIRTWAFYTIVKAWMHDRTIPWKEIVISGHVLTSQGQKISKSQSNSPLIPENLLNLYPADVVRYWTASATLGTDIAFSETQLKLGNRLMVKLWNAFRFTAEHTTDVEFAYKPSPTGVLNQWILSRAAHAFSLYKKYLDAHEFSLALESAERFFWHDFCDNYLELVKDQLFNQDLYTPAMVQETKQTLLHAGLRILQFFAPVMPHITETLYGIHYKTKLGIASIHQTRFADIHHAYPEFRDQAAMDMLLHLVQSVRKLKSDAKVSLKTDLDQLVLLCVNQESCDRLIRLMEPHTQLIKGIVRARSLEYALKNEAIQSYLEQQDEKYHAGVIIDDTI